MELVPPRDRDTILARYRRLRAVSIEMHNKALNAVGTATLLAHARRLGLAAHGRIEADWDTEMQMVFDLAIYTAAAANRSRPLERAWRTAPPDAGSDEAVLLAGMRRSCFSVWEVVRPHPSCGTMLRNILDLDDALAETWLMDEGIAHSVQPGCFFAARLIQPEAFMMTTGTIVPFDREIFTLTSPDTWLRHVEAGPGRDPRLPIEVYRAAIAVGACARVRYLGSGETVETARARLRA